MTEASVKNFQLCCANMDLSEDVVLQFGRVAKDRFTLDLKYPMSLFQVWSDLNTCFVYTLLALKFVIWCKNRPFAFV